MCVQLSAGMFDVPSLKPSSFFTMYNQTLTKSWQFFVQLFLLLTASFLSTKDSSWYAWTMVMPSLYSFALLIQIFPRQKPTFPHCATASFSIDAPRWEWLLSPTQLHPACTCQIRRLQHWPHCWRPKSSCWSYSSFFPTLPCQDSCVPSNFISVRSSDHAN